MSESVAATFLFTDLVGSTARSTQMSAADADTLRQRHFGLLRAAIAATAGREVKNLGDGLMVVFASPSRALAGAVEMQQRIHRHNRRTEDRLAVRIGLSTGEATEEDGDFFGDPVVEAARLCARAEGGQILATDLLRLTVGRHATFELSGIGELELKGLPQPVAVVEVRWEPSAEVGSAEGQGVPFPSRLSQYVSGGTLGFAGRDGELAAVGAWQKSSAVERRLEVVLVAGEPGVGKSALAAHVARRAQDQGATVLLGECAEGSAAPYLPWRSAVSHLVRHTPGEVLGRLSPVHAWALARLLPGEAPLLAAAEPVDADPDTEQFLMVQAVVQILELTSEEAPLLVVLDDLQWADSSSLTFLRRLIGSGARLGCLLVIAYRPSDLERGHPLTALLADLHREPNVHRVDLGGLDDAAILDAIETTAGYEMDELGLRLAGALRRETGGNPFFVAELVRHMSESGAVAMDASGRFALTGDLDDLALPQSLRDVVGQRVARLGPEARRVLTTAAVVGREFDLGLVATATGLDADEVLDIVEAATSAAIVVESDELNRYRFEHALIQHALDGELSAARRQRLHLRIAEALESSGAGAGAGVARLAELARHWQAATRPADAAKAIDYSRRAGDAAMEALAPADAARFYTQALELLDRDGPGDRRDRVRLLLALAGAQLASTQILEGLRSVKAAGALAEEVGDAELVIASGLTRVPNQSTADVADPALVGLLERGLELLDPEDHGRRARLLAALVDETGADDWRRRHDLAEQAVAAAAAAGDDGVGVSVFVATFFAWPPERALRSADEAEEAVRLAGQRRDPLALMAALGWCTTSRLMLGDIAGARAHVERLEELAVTFGLPIARQAAGNVRSSLCVLDGDLAGLERQAEIMLQVGLEGFPAALASSSAAYFQLRRMQGRLREYVDQFPDGGAGFIRYSGFRASLVHSLVAVGDLERARSVYEIDSSTRFERFPRDSVWLNAMSLFGEAAVDLGDTASAGVIHDLLVPFGHLHAAAGPIYYGVVDRIVGRLAWALGRAAEAEERLRRALEIHRRVPVPYWAAINALDLAELLAPGGRPGDRAEARRLRDEAAGIVGAGGFAGLEERVRQVPEA